jgi:thymidylate synthase (FAD)
MRKVQPKVFLISRPQLDWDQIREYLTEVGESALDWADRMWDADTDAGDALTEFGGRLCYRSWAPGLNVNVTKVREDSTEYLGNILEQQHGSVMEHANFSFVLRHVSRVLTHELVRHRAGCAYSQESLRYVRFTDLPVWFPDWALADEELMYQLRRWVEGTEDLQAWMADHFKLDEPGVKFSAKKMYTSFMRRFAPMGVATDILMTMNIRTLRHVIYMRTSMGAEEEIRLVMDQVAQLCLAEFPGLMQDFDPNEAREWAPKWVKV